MMQELIRAGDALVIYLDFPPVEAEESRKNARKALKEWQRVSDAAKIQLGLLKERGE
ncbi:hypothetical protein LCGC14_1521420 [marine sediment metagenome]|uniref:Uncharacterized protein n=1 Tax=marine sediment metagenome TaxID=412755 RepID=A0A0F9LZL2_9ZZZZ